MGNKILVVGTGYVGLVSGACFAELGCQVTCVDKDASKITSLNNGVIPIYEPGLDVLVSKNKNAGRIVFLADFPKENFDFVFLCVGTPTDPVTQNANMTTFFAAAKEVSEAIEGKYIVVSKSTVPVGTGKKLAEIFGDKAEIISNPEFLREGNAIHDFMNPDRVLIGANSPKAAEKLSKLYAPLDAKIMVTDIQSSELTKYASNTFLAMKVSFINEIAELCEKVGANVDEVAKGMGLDDRIGNKFLKAGPGIGGSCFPKDAAALSAQARDAGAEGKIISAVIASNETHKSRSAEKIIRIVGQGTVAIFGLTFKANTDDMRESPSLAIIAELQKAGLKVKAFDPAGMENAKKLLSGIEYATSPEAAANGADAIVILTEWDIFKKLDYTKLTPAKKIIIDLRNVLNAEQIPNYKLYGVGK